MRLYTHYLKKTKIVESNRQTIVWRKTNVSIVFPAIRYPDSDISAPSKNNDSGRLQTKSSDDYKGGIEPVRCQRRDEMCTYAFIMHNGIPEGKGRPSPAPGSPWKGTFRIRPPELLYKRPPRWYNALWAEKTSHFIFLYLKIEFTEKINDILVLLGVWLYFFFLI